VNDRVPRLTFNNAQALSTASGTYLVPTHIHSDSFSLVSAAGATRQYLSDTQVLESALFPVEKYVLAFGHESKSSQETQVAALASACSKFENKLDTQPWPTRDTRALQQLEQDMKTFQVRLGEWGRTHGSMIELKRIVNDGTWRAGDTRLRSQLGLPPSK
jgi:hypothetical protein